MKAESCAIQDIHSHTSYNPTISISTLYNPLYIRIHIYITYTYNNNVLCAYMFFSVCYAYVFYCAKTFSFILIIVVDERNYESLLEFYTTCLMVACLPLAVFRLLQKNIGLARNIYRNEIVTKYNLLFDIMTLTFCNNHCQHLFIC